MTQTQQVQVYKYNPEDFRNFLMLSEDIKNFYNLLEEYKYSNDKDIWFYLRQQWEQLFFSIKHRELEGLNPVVASEMREYFEDLLLYA